MHRPKQNINFYMYLCSLSFISKYHCKDVKAHQRRYKVLEESALFCQRRSHRCRLPIHHAILPVEEDIESQGSGI